MTTICLPFGLPHSWALIFTPSDVWSVKDLYDCDEAGAAPNRTLATAATLTIRPNIVSPLGRWRMFRSDCRRDALETPWQKALKMLRPPLKATSPNRKGLPSGQYSRGHCRQQDTEQTSTSTWF